MNKRIYKDEFTHMVHKKLKEDSRNIRGGDIWDTYWTIKFMLRTMADILANGDELVLRGYFSVEPEFYKESKIYSGLTKEMHKIPEQYKAKFKPGAALNRACEAYGDYLKEEANNQDDEYEEGEEE